MTFAVRYGTSAKFAWRRWEVSPGPAWQRDLGSLFTAVIARWGQDHPHDRWHGVREREELLLMRRTVLLGNR